MDLQEYLRDIGMTRDEWDRRRQTITANRDRFLKEYYEAHACCPKCGNENCSSTYVGYVAIIGEDLEVVNKDTFRDENITTCKCGWTGLCHERVSAGA